METVYVSNAVANGIPIGNDSTGDGSISAPYLTIAGALAALSANNSDTIYLNDGTYTVTATIDLVGFAGLSILGVTDYGATIATTSAVTQLIWIRSSGITLGRIVIDGGTASQFCIADASGPHASFTVDGTYIKHGGSNDAVLLDTINNVTFKGGWTAEKTANNDDDLLRIEGGGGGGTIQIYDGTIIEKFTTSGIVSLIKVEIDAASGPTSAVIHDITCQIDDSGLSSGDLVCVEAGGCSTVEIYNIVLDNANSVMAGRTTLVHVTNNAAACSSAYVHDINATLMDGGAFGVDNLGIAIGTNAASPNADSISNAVVENCTITGTNHGILLGDITGGVVRKCRVDTALSGIVMKRTDSCRAEGNIVTKCRDNYILSKQGTNDIIQFNTIQATTGYTGTPIRCGPDASDSVTPFVYNNVIYTSVQLSKVIDIEATEIGATVRFNNVYSSVALAAGSFRYEATTYSTLALFQTGGTSLGGTISDNTEHDPDLQSDFSIPSTSDAYLIGVNTWTATSQSPPVGYNDAVPSWDMSPGAMVDTSRPFHPRNL